jgi:hypothetical protein
MKKTVAVIFTVTVIVGALAFGSPLLDPVAVPTNPIPVH